MTGAFITLEGGEGSGKSTQIKLLAQAFANAGKPHTITREPGGTPGAERIRGILVSGGHSAWEPISETLLFYAARVEHVNRLIRPALKAGKTVICDRFADSTAIYQGIGKELSEEFVGMLHRLCLGNFAPNLTLILDIDPVEGLKRAAERAGAETRFEALPLDFHRRIRAGFLNLAKREPNRCAVLDAAQDRESLHRQVLNIIKQRLGITL